MKNTIIFLIGLLAALWFAFTGMVWVYYAALFLAYPAGLIAFGCWLAIKDDKHKRNLLIPGTLMTGLVLSLSVLGYLLIND